MMNGDRTEYVLVDIINEYNKLRAALLSLPDGISVVKAGGGSADGSEKKEVEDWEKEKGDENHGHKVANENVVSAKNKNKLSI